MPKKYKVTDAHTGKTYQFDWNGDTPPTEHDLNEMFTSVAPAPTQGAGGTGTFWSDSADASPAMPKAPLSLSERYAQQQQDIQNRPIDLPGGLALAAGLATGGMSAAPRLAAPILAGTGGKLAQEQMDQGLHAPTGEDISGAGWEGTKQALLAGIPMAAGKLVQGAGRFLYGAGVNPSLAGTAPGAIDTGLSQGIVRAETAASRGAGTQQTIDSQLAAIQQRPMPTSAITANPAKKAVSQRLIPDALSDLRSRAATGAQAPKINATLDQIAADLHASHPQGLTPMEMDAFRRATANDAASATGVNADAQRAMSDRAMTILESRSPGYADLAKQNQNYGDLASSIQTAGAQPNMLRRIGAGAGAASGFLNPLTAAPATTAAYLGSNPMAMRAGGVALDRTGAGVSSMGPDALRFLALQAALQDQGTPQTNPSQGTYHPDDWWSPRPNQ